MAVISQSFRCFDAVARQGSVRKAAETLHLTAAAVHQQIVNFEEQVGTPLFDRLPKGMQLSAAGEIVLAAVRRSQRDFEQALAQVEDLRSLRRGLVSVGAPHSSAETLIPAVVREVLGRHPGIRFDVRTGNGETVLRWLAGGEIDLAFCLRRTPPPGVEELRAWPQRLGAVVQPGHELAARGRRLRLRDVLTYPLALPAPGMEMRTLIDHIASRERRALAPVAQSTSVATLRTLAHDAGLVAVLVQENVAVEVASGSLLWLPLADADARSDTCLYQRIGRNSAVAAGVFVQFLDEAFRGQAQVFADIDV